MHDDKLILQGEIFRMVAAYLLCRQRCAARTAGQRSRYPPVLKAGPHAARNTGSQCRVASSSSLKPGGIRGGVSSSLGLHSGQGMPAPPHWQACGPPQGGSGWSSQTQRLS
jgi:hypothetical protein